MVDRGPRYSCKQLQTFRQISNCEQCVHYIGCPFWLSVLLLNGERAGPFYRMMLPDIEQPCLMFAKHPVYWGKPKDKAKGTKKGDQRRG